VKKRVTKAFIVTSPRNEKKRVVDYEEKVNKLR